MVVMIVEDYRLMDQGSLFISRFTGIDLLAQAVEIAGL